MLSCWTFRLTGQNAAEKIYVIFNATNIYPTSQEIVGHFYFLSITSAKKTDFHYFSLLSSERTYGGRLRPPHLARDCGLGLDVSVSRRSRDPLRPWSRSRNQGSRSWYRSRTVRSRAQVIFFAHMLYFFYTKCQPLVLFAQYWIPYTVPQTFTLANSIHLTNTQFWKASICKQILSSSFLFIIS